MIREIGIVEKARDYVERRVESEVGAVKPA